LAQFDAIFVTQLDQRARKLDNLEYRRRGLGVFTQPRPKEDVQA
jgi:hypothetical protein